MASIISVHNENPAVGGEVDLKKASVLTRRPLVRRQALGVLTNNNAVQQDQRGKINKPSVGDSKIAKPVAAAAKPKAVLAPAKLKIAETKVPVLAKPKLLVPSEKVLETLHPSPVKIQACDKNFVEFDKEDEDDYKNPQMVSSYVKDIYNYLRSVELSFPVKEDYLDGRRITGRMRGIILDWLEQVCSKFDLLPETYFLTTDLFDRFVQKNEDFVTKGNLQLIGVTALFIATKYEEMYSPPIRDYVYITDKSVTEKEIRLMEVKMLTSLDFFLGKPTPITFLRRLSKVAKVDLMVHSLAKYMIELCVVDYTMCHYRASILAAAAMLFSLQVMNSSGWTDVLSYHSKYEESELTPLVNSMAKIVLKAEVSKLQGVRKKFSGRSFYHISTVPELKSDLVKKMAAQSLNN